MMNYSVYFYQWCINSEHQHQLTNVFYRDQETFKVTVMNYYNTSIYVQQMTDWILHSYCDYFCVYVNNIIIYSATLTNHLQHLQNVFQKLTDQQICLMFKKFFLNYSSVHLLDQQVNILDLVTVKVKLVIITNLKFLHTLTQLKKYLEMTEYLWQYILHYVTIIKPLQLRKILLN